MTVTHTASDTHQRQAMLKNLGLVLNNTSERWIAEADEALGLTYAVPDLYLFFAYIAGAAAAEQEYRDQIRQADLRTMPYKEYLLTEEWHARREAQMEADGYRCRVCNSDSSLQVHHRTYERRGCEEPGDLTTLCAECHRTFHDNRQVARY